MLPRCRATRNLSVYTLSAIVCFVSAATSDAGARRPATRRALSAYDTAAVERARSRAVEKLREPACSRVLTDFKDDAGRTLAENLVPWNVSAAEYLPMVSFVDGSEIPECRRRRVEMVTVPGLPTVFVCPARIVLNSRFAQVADPALAEAMIIHEMLHTLGLGENPPSTFEITERVRERCR